MEKLEIPILSDRLVYFDSRPNRFLVKALSSTDGEILLCHLHDPGRLKEILIPGSELLLRHAAKTGRKTDWDVVAGKNGEHWVLINSSYHRMISGKILEDPTISPFGKPGSIRPEVKVGSSRLDYELTMKDGTSVFVEVKGCSLTLEGKALFPDAPTTRGARHLEELIELKDAGFRTSVMVLILGPGSRCFAPKEDTDPIFSETFYRALRKGVEVYPLSFSFDGKVLRYEGLLPICGSESQ